MIGIHSSNRIEFAEGFNRQQVQKEISENVELQLELVNMKQRLTLLEANFSQIRPAKVPLSSSSSIGTTSSISTLTASDYVSDDSKSTSTTARSILMQSSEAQSTISNSRGPSSSPSSLSSSATTGHHKASALWNALSLTFLGTGAAIPSLTRNVSSTYLKYGESGGILLDCGEGTLTQLYRLYGYEHTNR